MSGPPDGRAVPGAGQESVWDYPRPPRAEATGEHVTVALGGVVIVDTRRPVRVLETSHPPTYYVPRSDFLEGALREARGSSYCEWKGLASYCDLVGGQRVAGRAGWYYPQPAEGFELLHGLVAVYPAAVDGCTVDGERVRAQAGDFYGGWITSRVVGPFKGEPGTTWW